MGFRLRLFVSNLALVVLSYLKPNWDMVVHCKSHGGFVWSNLVAMDTFKDWFVLASVFWVCRSKLTTDQAAFDVVCYVFSHVRPACDCF